MAQLFLFVSGVISVSILARILGPYDYGRYNLFLFSAQILSIFASTWVLNPAAAKFASEEFLKSKSIGKTFCSELIIVFVNTIIVGLVLFLLRSRIGSFLSLDSNFVTALIFVYMVCFAAFNLFYFCFQGSLQFKAYGLMPLVRSLIFIILLILVISFKSLKFNLAVSCLSLSYIIAILIFWPKLKGLCPLRIDTSMIRDILSFSWPVIFFVAGNFSLDWVDKYMLRMLISTYAVGIYSAAWTLTSNLVMLPQLLYTLIMPIITSYKIQERSEHVKFYLNKFVPQCALFFSFFVTLGIVFASVFMPMLYGSKYAESINIFIILALGSLFMGIKYFYNPVSTVFNFIRLTGSVNLITAIFCLLLNFVFISAFGMTGAAVATAVSSLLACAAVMFIINKQFGIVNFWALFCSLPALVTALLCLFSKSFLINLLFSAVIFGLLYLLVRKLKIFSKADIVYIEKIDMPAWAKRQVLKFYRSFD